MFARLPLALAICLAPLATWALDRLPQGEGPTVLTIRAHGAEHALDATALRALPADSFVTETIWTEGEQAFTGVRMTELLNRLDIHSGQITLVAANDYQIRIDVEDFTPDGALLAYERNGAPMTLRDKGPVWLVYPYDADARFRTEIIYANSIWQLDRIVFDE
ncbi:molybdopterin-dependent oxidoreductase [Pseudooceanicola sp.]|uniref:molybdopterin-dependent oxidoreductase n=1 Tax=Pseudooceanicola sp. TaxID=1914328 RepID=UPI0035C6A206